MKPRKKNKTPRRSKPSAARRPKRLQLSELDRRVDRLQDRLTRIQRDAQGGDAGARRALPAAVEDLQTTLEELQVAEEELRQQNDELVAAHATIIEERARYVALFEFAPDGYLVTDLHGIIKEYNRAATTLLALRHGELAGKPFATFVARADRGRFRTELNALARQKRADLHIEMHLRRRHSPDFFASANIAAIGEKGKVVGLRWMFRDITHRKLAEEALQKAHDQLETRVRERTKDLASTLEDLKKEVRKSEDLAKFPSENPNPVLRMSAEGKILYANAASAGLLKSWRAKAGGPAPVEWRRFVREALSAEAPWQTEVQHEGRTLSIFAVPVSKGPYVNVYVRDITERKQAEERLRQLNRTLRALSRSNRALMHAEDELEYLNEACGIIVKDCGHAMVWIGYAENDADKTVRPVAWSGFEDGYIEKLNVTWADTPRGRGPTGTAIRTGKPCVCTNMLTDPQFAPWRDQAVKRGYASSIVLPMLADGKAFGAISIYFKQPGPLPEDETALLTELANDIARGITSIRLRRATAAAEQALRDSEQRYRQLFTGMTEGFGLHEIVCDRKGVPRDYRFLEVNPAFEALTGLKRQDVTGKLVSEVLPGTEPYWIETYGRVALTGEPAHIENYSAGLKRWFEVFAYRPAPGQFAVLFTDITARKDAEQVMREAKEKLEARVEERTAELKRAMEAVGAERQRFNHVLNEIPPYVILLTPDYRVAFANRVFRERFGDDNGRRCYEFLFQRTEPCENCETYKVLKTMKPHHWEWTGPDGRNYDIFDFPFTETNGTTLILEMGIDITERKRAERAVQESEARYRAIMEEASEGVLVTDAAGAILEANSSLCRTLGYEEAELTGRNLAEFIPEEEIAAKPLPFDEVRAGKTVNAERRMRRKDGVILDIEGTGKMLLDGRLLLVLRDITAQRLAREMLRAYQSRLKSMSTEMSLMEERQRREIARDLHDRIGQALAVSKMRLGALKTGVKDVETIEALAEVFDLISRTLDDTRSLTFELCPPILYDLGLEPAIEYLVEEFGRQTGIAAQFSTDEGPKPLDDSVRGILFRSVRELLHNVRKHAGARRVRVSVRRVDHSIEIAVEDDGAGFDASVMRVGVHPAGGFGLFGIREQIGYLGGYFNIESSPGKGTRAVLTAALRKDSTTSSGE